MFFKKQNCVSQLPTIEFLVSRHSVSQQPNCLCNWGWGGVGGELHGYGRKIGAFQGFLTRFVC